MDDSFEDFVPPRKFKREPLAEIRKNSYLSPHQNQEICISYVFSKSKLV